MLARYRLDSSQREFLSKLRAVDHDTVLSKIPGGWTRSSRWFLELPEFKSWRVLQGQQTLWLYGVPGSGKTVLMKSIVEFLNIQSDIASSPVIWKPISFFFDDNDPERKTSDSFIRSIPDTEKSLWGCFQTIVKRSRGIIFQLVIDAVDEALRHNENPPTIVDKLRDLVESDASGRVRMLLSHREQPPYGFLQRTDAAVISIDNENTRKNVDEFVQMKVRSSLQESKLSLSMASTIEAKIVKKAQGNFLFATLAWKQFSNGTVQWTRDKIKASLTGLDKTSDDLVDFYCQLLSNISSRYRQKAMIAFTILRLCKESISPTQLATMAVMIDMEGIEQDEDLEDLKAQAADFEEYLVQACEYMVKIDNNSVQFVHVSVKDMLSMSLDMHSPRNQSIISELTVSNSEGQSIMLNICLKTMHLERRRPESWLETYGAMTEALRSLRETFSGLVPNHEQLTQIDELTNSHVDSMSKTSCLAYAVRNWFQHYKEASPSVEQDVKMINFLCTMNGCLCYMLWYQLPTKDDGGKIPYLSRYPAAHLQLESSRTMTLFRVIALGDLPRLVGAILRRGVNINYLAGTVTPLSWSIICRRRDSFQALLESNEIEVNYHAYRQRASIHHAASCIEDTFYMERLLEFTNIDVNAVGDNGTPLHVAITSKNIQEADKLLNHPLVNIYFKADMEESPHSMAFRHKIWEPFLLRILDMTEKPKPPSTRQAYGTSQLLWAGVHGWTNMEERILREYHNQVFLVDQESRMNALAHYAYFGRKEKLSWIIDRLPTHGLLLRGASDRYDLLHLCASQDWEDMVHLLQRKYKLKSLKFDHQGRNMLHWIMEHGWDLDRFDLSCYSVSDLNSQDRDDLTPMHIVASNRNIHALEVLVISGADPYLKDKRGMSPAHLAAQVGWRKGVEYLTDTSHRELGRTRDGATLLHLVAIWFEGSLVSKLLCSRQGMTNARDGNRRTPLHYASINDNASAMIALLDAGGEINARDENGMTPLHEAIRCLSVKTARLLLKRGADFKAIDGFGQTCLHLSVRYKHNYLLKKFIKIGLAANAYDKFGMSPLHRACSTGVSEHVQMLLEKGASYKARNTHQRSPLDIAVHRENVKAIEVLISWLDHAAKRGDKKPRRSRTRQELLDQALLLAYQFGCEKASARLRSAGAKADKSTISVRQVYMDGPSPESRWPLKPYKSQARSAINKEL
ncbi:Leucine carboxyl methyltransferase 1 [Fusarium oxysporum f. sp. albedinis]|nr:Leucine carboxyl methyltransferase 1 [Fusarium oxysporum f. sp. albedinis]